MTFSNDSLETACLYFEKNTNLNLTLHDLSGELWKYLAVTRFQHRHALCQKVKSGPKAQLCIKLELEEFRRVADQWKQGRLHQCHAGLSEIALPIFEEGQFIVVLFAGPFQTIDKQMIEHTQVPSISLHSSQRKGLPLLTNGQVAEVREGLSQVGARIRCQLKDQYRNDPDNDTRTAVITRYLFDRYADPIRIKNLADELSLSEDRARHVIREELGMSFSTALKKVRIKAACSKLLNTDDSVEKISWDCGIADPSCFTRYFKAECRLTPHQWRKCHRG